MSDTSIKINIPKDGKGVLKWVFIDGKGRKNLSGEDKFTAQVVLTPEQAKPYIEQIDAYWKENRPSWWKVTAAEAKKDPKLKVGEFKEPFSLGYKEDEEGNFIFQFNTNIVYVDGTDKEIAIYNAKANKISLGGKKIGNGSEGALGGAMDVYENKPTSAGVTFYLNAIQLTKFVEFSADAGFESVDEEGAFEGIDESMGQFEPQTEDNQAAKPRL